MTIEVVALAHHPQYVETIAGWFESQWPEWFGERDARAWVTEHARTDRLPMALVALVDGEPVGTVSLRTDWEAHPEGPWVAGLLVQSHARGSGIGSLLTQFAARLAWEFGNEHVFVATQDATLYERLGWEEVESIRRSDGRWLVMRAARPEPPPSLYDQIGGDEVVRKLVDRFYDHMDEREEATEIRAMHARSLKSSRDKLYKFLSGWLGGPDLYIQEHGHPRLRMRHMPFSIGTAARDQWLDCMEQALEEVIDDEQIRADLLGSFTHLADHMRNRPGT